MTDTVGSLMIRQLADLSSVPIQDFIVKNDSACGSTIGPMVAAKAGLKTVDIGAPMLGMHSIRETCGILDLYYYKGLNVVKKTYQERLQLLLDMFTTQVEQIAYAPNSLIVGLPIICETYEEALTQLEQPYKTYGIAAMGTAAHIKQNGTATHATATHAPTATVTNATVTNTAFATVTNTTVTNTTVTNATATHATVAPIKQNATNTTSYGKAVFKIKAGLAADNYQLYTLEDKFYDTALVPTYKCSVLLNGLFRNIKENANLDLLEESDDEEEFENTQIDKFVDLEKTVIMECVYNKRFKKWQPLKTTQARIISFKELK